MRYEVAPMLEADLREVVELEDITGLNRWGFEAYRRELLSNSMSVMRVARPLDGYTPRRILGFVAAAISYDELHINNIATHPDYRRLGIARSLLNDALREGRLRHASVCVLEVRASNAAAQILYQRLGFRTSRRRKDYYRMPNEDALEMLLSM